MKITKKQMTDAIESYLRLHPGREVIVKDFGWELRNKFSMHAYVIVSDNGTDMWCKPWSGANVVWRIPWFRMKAEQVRNIYDKIKE